MKLVQITIQDFDDVNLWLDIMEKQMKDDVKQYGKVIEVDTDKLRAGEISHLSDEVRDLKRISLAFLTEKEEITSLITDAIDGFKSKYSDPFCKLEIKIIPKNIKECIQEFDNTLEDWEKSVLKNQKPENTYASLYMKLHNKVVHEWVYSPITILSKHLKKFGVKCGTMAANIVMNAYIIHLSKRSWDIKDLVKFYKESCKEACESSNHKCN